MKVLLAVARSIPAFCAVFLLSHVFLGATLILPHILKSPSKATLRAPHRLYEHLRKAINSHSKISDVEPLLVGWDRMEVRVISEDGAFYRSYFWESFFFPKEVRIVCAPGGRITDVRFIGF